VVPHSGAFASILPDAVLFNSFAFSVFAAVVLAGYYSLRPVRWQNAFLLTASLVF